MRERAEETVLEGEVDGVGGGGLVDRVGECEAEMEPDSEGEEVLDAVCDDERVVDEAIAANAQKRNAFLRKPCRVSSVMSSNNTTPPSPAAFSTPAEKFRELWTSRDEA